VPLDLAITGFDDNVLGRFTEPPLTTVKMPLADMGKTAVEILLGLISGEQDSLGKVVVLPTELVVRESSGGPSRLLL
jgi:LacI family repressor for deo operon, udp, cdd, tsx, nupC, and nupG